MVIALNPDSTFEYVLKADREAPIEQQTVWVLRGLRHKERADVEDTIASQDSEGRMSFRVGSQRTRILLAGIRGVRNFRDEDGRELEVPKGGCSTNFLDHLRDEWCTELANAITERGAITEKDSD